MRYKSLLFVALASIMLFGCVPYHRTIYRVHTLTPPPVFAPTPMPEWADMPTMAKMVPMTPETRTYGRILNHWLYAFTMHLPPEILTCTQYPRTYQELMKLIEEAKANNTMDKLFVHYDFVSLKAMDSVNWWFSAPIGTTYIAIDYTREWGWTERGTLTITSDNQVADHLCGGVISDWFNEVGANTCR